MALMLLIASYVVDWVILIVFAAVGYVIGNLSPHKRAFHLQDPDIDFPYLGYDTVSVPILGVVALVVPAAIIFLMSMLMVPRATIPGASPKPAHIWRRKLWEWHAGWLGLALSLVIVWFFTSGMKNLFGKPRPNLIGRCQPDFDNVADYLVNSVANASDYGQLVSADICTNADQSAIDEGFRSFPSGHCSFAAGGLVYLSLIIAAKLGTGVPFLSYGTTGDGTVPSAASAEPDNADQPNGLREQQGVSGRTWSMIPARNQGASAPIYLLVPAFVPFGTALFIAASRWFDYQHHGFDILFGFLMGTLSSIFAFRYYHLPLNRGAGWAWGPRNGEKPFWSSGVGSGGHATGNESYRSHLPWARDNRRDYRPDNPDHEFIQLQTV